MPFRQANSGTSITADSPLATALCDLIVRERPKRILETGTYDGHGSTRVIAKALHEHGIPCDFRSIEVNRRYARIAGRRLKDLPVSVLHGCSLPASRLPDAESLSASLCELQHWDHLFVDHDPRWRVQTYLNEFAEPCGDDLMGAVMADWQGQIDIALLDSSGALGFAEFTYLLSLAQSPFWLVLDDTRHVKHARSAKVIADDPAWRVEAIGDDRSGWLIARHEP